MTQEYPLTIAGTATDRATGETVPLVVRRTGEIEDGCEIYSVSIPYPGTWFRDGRVGLHFDKVPGLSTFRLQFEGATS